MATLPADIEPRLKSEVERLGRDAQLVAHKQFKTKPNVRDIPEGGFVIGVDGGTQFIYTKINGVRHKATLTPDP